MHSSFTAILLMDQISCLPLLNPAILCINSQGAAAQATASYIAGIVHGCREFGQNGKLLTVKMDVICRGT